MYYIGQAFVNSIGYEHCFTRNKVQNLSFKRDQMLIQRLNGRRNDWSMRSKQVVVDVLPDGV